MRVALVNALNVVAEVVLAGPTYAPPPGWTAVASDTANIGDHYIGGEFVPIVPTLPVADLVNYANGKQVSIAKKGVSVNLAAPGDPALMASVDTSATGRADLAGLYLQALTNPAFTTTWVQSSGPFTITAAQIIMLSNAVAAFISATYQTLGAVTAAINAGAITTLPQVDAPQGVTFNGAPLPAWPVNS